MEDLQLLVGGVKLFGWDSIRVTCGIERCPNDFALGLSQRFAGELQEIVSVVNVGDECEVLLDGDRVITGYVNRSSPGISRADHSISIDGRGRCQDLVDCAAEWPGGQISASSALGIAQKLCAPYGLSASSLVPDDRPVPRMILNAGETAFEIIERVCRFAALLAYEGPDGNLVLGRVGTEKAASGFKEGINVESAALTFSDDQQFSEYMVVRMAMDVLQDAGDAGNLVGIVANPYIRRHRRRIIVAEGGDPGSEIALRRAAWECSRRFGRSAQLRLTTDGWRDVAGALYRPNTLVPLELPTLGLDKRTWLVSEVTYRKDRSGTFSDLVIMPPEAFAPEPILLQPSIAELGAF